MSTYYYELREPWSSIRVYDSPGPHTQITLWNDGAYSGMLTINEDHKQEALDCFFDRESSIGNQYGRGQGKLLGYNHQRDPRTDQIISEYGDICSYKELCKTVIFT